MICFLLFTATCSHEMQTKQNEKAVREVSGVGL